MSQKTTAHKYYDLEILEGEYVYSAYELKAKSFKEAIMIMKTLFDERIDLDSEVMYFDEKTIH